ncbi:MAG: prepilin-type N-terminal cleavage/methylation domain-containing protein [Deltaproteobacteria bacterium]|nr:prepilin-type N-terminal cleavage/methylation domain-containing protein [Deltaproteobacteria bacterium]
MSRSSRAAGFTLMELMVTLAIIALLSSVAIPAFVGYLKKAKSAEATSLLQKLYAGSRIYYLENRQFPEAAAITPALGTCCISGGDKCAPLASQWTDATWVALQFSVDDPHYYVYQYTTDDVRTNFYVRAFGDLDCDGEFSTFQMMGEINSQYADGPAGTASIYKIKERE